MYQQVCIVYISSVRFGIFFADFTFLYRELELSQEVSELHMKWLQLKWGNNELTRHTAIVASEIAHLRDDNKFLANINAEFGSENDDLKEEVNELKTKLE